MECETKASTVKNKKSKCMVAHKKEKTNSTRLELKATQLQKFDYPSSLITDDGKRVTEIRKGIGIA